MAPNVKDGLSALDTEENNNGDRGISKEPVSRDIYWVNVAFFLYLHICSMYAVSLIPSAHLITCLFSYVLLIVGELGITAGAHRLWSHRSYKATLPLKVILIVFNLIAAQGDVIKWCRDHRVHHKYSETNADPHNAKRGFFFAHIGWMIQQKQPDVLIKGRQLDMKDLTNDPLLAFQRRYYQPLVLLMCYMMPTLVPWLCWEESLWNSYFIACILRYWINLNLTWLVNSAAHMWGMRPYDKNINPAENFFVTVGALGEGFHNYHHTFPQDYSTSEFGMFLNPTTLFINLMAKLGWAYDLKTIPKEVILSRQERTGDVPHSGHRSTKTLVSFEVGADELS